MRDLDGPSPIWRQGGSNKGLWAVAARHDSGRPVGTAPEGVALGSSPVLEGTETEWKASLLEALTGNRSSPAGTVEVAGNPAVAEDWAAACSHKGMEILGYWDQRKGSPSTFYLGVSER